MPHSLFAFTNWFDWPLVTNGGANISNFVWMWVQYQHRYHVNLVSILLNKHPSQKKETENSTELLDFETVMFQIKVNTTSNNGLALAVNWTMTLARPCEAHLSGLDLEKQ